MKTILITGASGYIGTRLLQTLGEDGHHVIAVVRNKKRLTTELVQSLGEQLTIVEVDFSKPVTVPLDHKIDAAYYLLHSMSGGGDYSELEASCALHFTKWITTLSCSQLIYLGALLPTQSNLSTHLKSRERVHDLLSESTIPLTTLRASIIVGSGSASFEIIRDLTEKLPFMITPKWVSTQCQPIAVRNVLFYLKECAGNAQTYAKDFDIGGPNILSYGEMLKGYAKIRGLKRFMIPVPFLSAKLSSHWLHFITAAKYKLAKSLIGSLRMKTVCENNEITKIIPQKLYSYEQAIERALVKIAQNRVPSTWYDSLLAGNIDQDQFNNIKVPEHGILTDQQHTKINIPSQQCLNAVWSLGGKNGWPSFNWAWKVRGFIDKLFGGIGLRTGRRHPTELRSGDVLDFWRVILADRQEGRLILYAEMKLPGEAWLEFKVSNGFIYQTATFRPKGLIGRLYWWCTYPIHLMLFPRMIKQLANGWKQTNEDPASSPN